MERPDGAVSRTRVIDAPPVIDATTSATHSIQTGGLAGDRVVDQYEYVALLDDRHMVTVTSFANPTDTKAVGEQVAAAALRGGQRGAVALSGADVIGERIDA